MRALPLAFAWTVACGTRAAPSFEASRDRIESRIGARPIWSRGGPEERLVEETVRELTSRPLELESAVKVALLQSPTMQGFYASLAVTESSREKLGEARADAEALERLDAVVAEVARVKQLFIEAQLARELEPIGREVAAMTEAFLLDTRARVRRGEPEEVTALRDEARYEAARLAVLESETKAGATRDQLSRALGLWGSAVHYRLEAALRGVPTEEVRLDGLETLAVAERTDLAASKLRTAALAYDLQKAGNRTLCAVFDDRSEARLHSELHGQRAAVTARAIAIRGEVRELRDALVAARRRAEHLRDVVLPLHARIAEAVAAPPKANGTSRSTNLEDRLRVLDARADLLRAMADYWKLRFALERTVGGKLR